MLWPRMKCWIPGWSESILWVTRYMSSTRCSSPSDSANVPRSSGLVSPWPRWSWPMTAMPRPLRCSASGAYLVMCSIMPWAIWSVATGDSGDHSTQWRSVPGTEDVTVNSRNGMSSGMAPGVKTVPNGVFGNRFSVLRTALKILISS